MAASWLVSGHGPASKPAEQLVLSRLRASEEKRQRSLGLLKEFR